MLENNIVWYIYFIQFTSFVLLHENLLPNSGPEEREEEKKCNTQEERHYIDCDIIMNYIVTKSVSHTVVMFHRQEWKDRELERWFW